MNASAFIPALLPGEIIVDSFAGGGGASLGIEQALGRSPDIAINHDVEALAMHAINHPTTRHLPHNVWKVDPVAVTGGAPVGLLWASPDCKHHSKAKGGKPVKRAIRDLAWVVVRWARQVRPRIIMLENVEEFRDWGPLDVDGRPCRERKGKTFDLFVAELRRLGYRVEHRELRACDFGAPTIRKRLFLIARRDGAPILWPEATHNPAHNPDVVSGKLKPWRTAAGIIDWSLPCHSIFLTREEARAVGVNRPLANNTMARIARGVKRYVLDAAAPFIVPVIRGGGEHSLTSPFATYAQQGGAVRDLGAPLHTITASTKDNNGIVAPFVTKFRQGATGQAMDDPLATVTANGFVVRPGGASPLGIVAPHLMTMRNAEKPFSAGNEPAHTVTAGGAGLAMVAPHLVSVAHGDSGGRREYGVDEPVGAQMGSNTHAVVAPILVTNTTGHAAVGIDEQVATLTSGAHQILASSFLVPRYGERPGQEPRTRSIEEPAPVVVPTANGGSLAAVHLSRQFGASVGSGVDEPIGTMTAGGGGKSAIVAAFLAQHNGDRSPKPGRPADEPVSTVVGTGGQQNLVTAFLAQHNSDNVGHKVSEPVSTIVGKGCTQGVVQASFLSHAYTSNTCGGNGDLDRPKKTVTAGGTHAAEVRAFLTKYYGPAIGQGADEPLHTATAKPRFGLVTVEIAGEPYVIVDIGMRMLAPRELFRAQGFPDGYVIERGCDVATGAEIRLTKTAQVRMCGNSVCPDVAAALVRANVGAKPVKRRGRAEREAPLFAGEAGMIPQVAAE